MIAVEAMVLQCRQCERGYCKQDVERFFHPDYIEVAVAQIQMRILQELIARWKAGAEVVAVSPMRTRILQVIDVDSVDEAWAVVAVAQIQMRILQEARVL